MPGTAGTHRSRRDRPRHAGSRSATASTWDTPGRRGAHRPARVLPITRRPRSHTSLPQAYHRPTTVRPGARLLGQRADQLELDAAVLRPRGVQLVALEVLGALDRDRVAVALGGQPRLVDALADQVGLDRVGARLRQRLVVGELAATLERLVVGVALDLELEVAELLE